MRTMSIGPRDAEHTCDVTGRAVAAARQREKLFFLTQRELQSVDVFAGRSSCSPYLQRGQSTAAFILHPHAAKLMEPFLQVKATIWAKICLAVLFVSCSSPQTMASSVPFTFTLKPRSEQSCALIPLSHQTPSASSFIKE